MDNKRVPLMRRYGFAFALTGFFFAMFFQNCDGGFHYDPTVGLVSNSSLGDNRFRLTTFSPNGIILPAEEPFVGGLEYKIVASGSEIATATLLWQFVGNNSGACILKAGTGPEVRYVSCTRAGAVSLEARAILADGQITSLMANRTTNELIVDACGPSSSVRNVFRIANGTNQSPWNSTATPLVVFVGQILRICNDDAVSHQLFTDGNPCAAQPASMAKGQFYDCAINSVTGAPAGGTYAMMYDRIAGANATFNVRPYDGVALYADTSNSTTGTNACAGCHQPYGPNSTRKGRTFAQIKNAIATVPAMAVFQNQTLLTDDEIRAIAFSLSLL